MQDGTKINLHVFCNASKRAFALVAHWQFEHEKNRRVALSFIAAKSRVASVKQLSILRLELQAALQASRLAQTIIV